MTGVHRALLSGLLANVAIKTDKRDYLGTRNRHLHIFPGLRPVQESAEVDHGR